MERSTIIRKLILKKLERLGIKIDIKKNNSEEKERTISSSSSKVKVMVIATNEELEIAKETKSLI
jgi:acetate kinase